MSSKFIYAVDRNLLAVNPQQKWVKSNLHYEVIMGSQAYGVTQDSSDMDIYGWCIPPKHILFPATIGYVPGFGQQPEAFNQFQLHHVKDEDKGVEYDFSIYNIVKYLHLVVENNPNMIDSIFVPQHCITHITALGQMVRDRRKQFLHKGAYHKFKGYAYAQIHKIRIKDPNEKMSTKRRADIEKHGFDTKFAYHCVRLLDECEQILTTHDIDLTRNREQLKAIRRGEWTLEQLESWFTRKEQYLEELYQKSTLPHGPDWKQMNEFLLNILEHHYGSLQEVVRMDNTSKLIEEINEVLLRYH